MLLDVTTLSAAATCITGLLGIFLLVVWIQERSVGAMAWWAGAYLVGAIAVSLWALKSPFGPHLNELPNILLFIACGMIWSGARLFHGRKISPSALLAGAWFWFMASRVEAVVEWDYGRILFSSVIIATYAFMTSIELRRERRKSLQWVTTVAPALHSGVFLTPIVATWLMPWQTSADGWFTVFALQTLIYVVGTAFVLVVMANERTTAQYKTAAMTDPLTGLYNRRAFFAAATAMIAQQMRKKRPVSVLAFDLDHFKSVNDRFGHAIGDDTLRLFAATASDNMRASDVIGRLGGEEFVAILPGTKAEAAAVAERVRAAYEKAGAEISGQQVKSTVSIGVAEAGPPLAEFGELLGRADAALYKAKHGGRNRVTMDEPSSQPEATPVRQPKNAAA